MQHIAVFRPILGIFLAWLAAPVFALELSLQGQANLYPGLPEQWRGSGALTAAFHHYAREKSGQTHNLDLELFARGAQGAENARQHADIRELSYLWADRQHELRLGVGRVNWGVTESVHLVDIVNQDDALEDIDGEDKLGQPLLGATRRLGTGRVGVLLLPRFRPRAFGPVFRELSPYPIVADEARYASSRAEQHLDLALRFTQRFDRFDLAISHFRGTAREPRLVPCAARGSGRPGTESTANCDLAEAFAPTGVEPVDEALISLGELLGPGPLDETLQGLLVGDAQADIVLLPHYDQIQQWGLSAQYTQGAAAWKLEARHRKQLGVSQRAVAAGIEYGLGVFLDGLLDVGVLFEYLYDDRDAEQYLLLFQDDLFLGLRLLGNDIAGTQALGGVIIDRDDGSVFASFEASRRLGGNMRLSLETRLFEPASDAGLTTSLDKIDSLRMQLEYYF